MDYACYVFTHIAPKGPNPDTEQAIDCESYELHALDVRFVSKKTDLPSYRYVPGKDY